MFFVCLAVYLFACLFVYLFVCLFVCFGNNTSAVCGKVCMWKSPGVIASCVEACFFGVFRQLVLVYIAGKQADISDTKRENSKSSF